MNVKCQQCGRWRWDHEGRRCDCASPAWPNWRAEQGHNVRLWHAGWLAEVFRVLKPAGRVKAFGGSRMFHHLAAAMEEVGFSHITMEAWCYATGFPKSMDMSKAVDKVAFRDPIYDEIRSFLRYWRDERKISNNEVNHALGLSTRGSGMAGHWFYTTQPEIPSIENWLKLKALFQWPECDLDEAYARAKSRARDGAERPVLGDFTKPSPGSSMRVSLAGSKGTPPGKMTAAATDQAVRWTGWGTNLKPAWEPVIIGVKPG